ncbi:MAG TPA: hypothetical protein DCE71_05985, partial [Parachlamydiales bacterium]|nr:hypothetical protein [Parachlamydiales bacterium]
FFFDPNFGTLVFTKKENEELDELVVRMAICYEELYAWAYNPKSQLFAKRLVPLSPEEKPPEPLSKQEVLEKIAYHGK